MAQKVFGMEYVPAYNGDQGLVREFGVTAAQTFGVGTPLVLASGLVSAAAALNAELGNVILLGFAMAPVTNAAAGTRIPVQVVRPGDTFLVKLQSDDTFAATDVNDTGFDLFRTSTGDVVVNTDDSTNPKVIIDGTAEVNADGTTSPTIGGPVYVHIIRNANIRL